MTRTLYARLIRLGRWPRRVAALLCLALAAASALSAKRPATADAPVSAPLAGVTARLAPGQLAVPVTLSDDAASAYLHVRDRIELYAGPDDTGGRAQPAALLGSRLLIVAVLGASSQPDGTGGTHVIVAADRPTAARVAGADGQRLLAVVDKDP